MTENTDTTAPASTRPGRRAPVLVGIGLALAFAAPVASGPLAGTAGAAALRPAAVVAPAPTGYFGPTIGGAIRTGADIALDRQSIDMTAVTSEGTAVPTHVAPGAGGNSETRFSYHSGWPGDAEITFRYAINGGPYVMWGHTKVTSVGANLVEAQIRLTGSTHEAIDSPYYVVARWMANGGGGYDPRPEFDVFRKDTVVVTDRAQQAELFERFCADGGAQCSYVPKSLVPDLRKAPINVTDVFYNATSEKAEFGFDKQIDTTTVDTIGVKVGAEAKLLGMVKASVEVAYEHSVEVTHTTKERHTMSVPPRHHAQYRFIQGYDEVKGDLVLFGDGKRYELRDVDFQFPTVNGMLMGIDLDEPANVSRVIAG